MKVYQFNKMSFLDITRFLKHYQERGIDLIVELPIIRPPEMKDETVLSGQVKIVDTATYNSHFIEWFEEFTETELDDKILKRQRDDIESSRKGLLMRQESYKKLEQKIKGLLVVASNEE